MQFANIFYMNLLLIISKKEQISNSLCLRFQFLI